MQGSTRITSYNVCYTKLLRELVNSPDTGSTPATTGKMVKLMCEGFEESAEGEWAEWQFLTGKLDFTGVRDQLKRRRSEEREAAVQQLARVIGQSMKSANNDSYNFV